MHEIIVGVKADFKCLSNIDYPNITSYIWKVKNQDGILKQYNKSTSRFSLEGQWKNVQNKQIDISWCRNGSVVWNPPSRIVNNGAIHTGA